MRGRPERRPSRGRWREERRRGRRGRRAKRLGRAGTSSGLSFDARRGFPFRRAFPCRRVISSSTPSCRSTRPGAGSTSSPARARQARVRRRLRRTSPSGPPAARLLARRHARRRRPDAAVPGPRTSTASTSSTCCWPRAALMKWCDDPLLLPGDDQALGVLGRVAPRGAPRAHGKYLFVYPFVKTREWYGLPAEERYRIMQEHIRSGREYPSIDLNTSYSFGLDDQEFVVAFEADDPAEFLDLVQRLRDHRVERATPSATPRPSPASPPRVERALDALDGEALASSPFPAETRTGNDPSSSERPRRGPRHHRDRRRPGGPRRPPSGRACARPAPRIIDSLPDIGGQLTTLYPEKWIFDVPGYPRILAKRPGREAARAGARAVRRPGPSGDDRRAHLLGADRARRRSSSCTPTAATCARAP